MGKQHQGLLFGDKKPKELNIIAHIIKYYDFFFKGYIILGLELLKFSTFFRHGS